ncbi:hypothetical protein LTR36_007647 [Oleoguttula mirabilis]|uniref:Uncharacterized protein n=1 Tax=Oleoguttula mirabilis TaxID=1507867 RepID=A0AAV9JUH7_9PEZI|nr:hypothetical protein LTR36_007647 [Oleoguttula mirabilis]
MDVLEQFLSVGKQGMALQQVNESDEEEYHSLGSGQEPGDGEDDEARSIMEPPMHPVTSMQGAFEESILESDEHEQPRVTENKDGDAEARRQKLLDAKQYDDSWATRWKQKAGAQYHPLLKLMAQIVFGMHLLQQQQAKSDEEVVKILQTHVNEVDGFLERTSDDFDLAIADIEERIRHLKLPMTHLDVFNIMLDDKKFRTQLLDGNDKIEKIIDRTAKAMNAALMDVRKGMQATQELAKYLERVRDRWPRQQRDIAEVYGAMRGNEQGWIRYLQDLQAKGSNLGNNLIRLGTVIGEMSKLAAAASRRNRPQSRPLSPARSVTASPALRSRFSRDTPPTPAPRKLSLNKPLPKEPDAMDRAAQFAIPKLHPVPFAQRYESPRQSPSPQAPPMHSRKVPSMLDASPARPKTAGETREARYSKGGTPELADYLKSSGPLRSNPPEPSPTNGDGEKGSERRWTRTRSQGATEILNGVSTIEAQAPVAHSKSQGTAMVLTSRAQSRGVDMVITQPSSRRAEKALSVKSQPASRKDSVASTGFGRRLSMRMKHLPPPDETPATTEASASAVAAPAPTDLASSSGTDRKPSTAPQRSATTKTTSGDPTRPPSRLGLFPRASEPLTPSAASFRDKDRGFSHSNGRHIPNATPEVPKQIQSTKSRSMSFRDIFHRKQWSRNAMA